MKTAQILRELREARHMSQDEIAKALGIDRTTYVKYEHGGSIKRNLPKLADFFHVSTDYLLGRSEGVDYGQICREAVPQACDTALASYSTKPVYHAPPYSERESNLVRKYRKLKPEHQKAVDIQVDYFHDIDSKQTADS